MINPIHVIKGWFFSLIYEPISIKMMSVERLKKCHACTYAVESSTLKIINGIVKRENCKKCKFCGCPIIEKSKVKKETCELNKW